jgi:hypothetical protein
MLAETLELTDEEGGVLSHTHHTTRSNLVSLAERKRKTDTDKAPG